MEELSTLRTYIKEGRYVDALQLIDELDEKQLFQQLDESTLKREALQLILANQKI